jgi:sensor domain CHASE-containing protein
VSGQVKRFIFFGPERNALLVTALALAALVAVWLFGANQYQAYLVEQQRVRMQGQLASYQNALTTSLSRRLVLLQALRAWTEAELETRGAPDEIVFEAVARGLFETTSGNHAVWLAPDGIQAYVYPPGEPGKGVDLLHTGPPQNALDAQRAAYTHEIVVSAPEITASGYDLRANLAINAHSQFWGLVTIDIDLPAVFTDAGLDAAQANVHLALRDGSDTVIYGDAAVFTSDAVTAAINFPGGEWQLAALPPGGWMAQVQDVLALARALGLAAVALIAGFIYTSLNRQSRLARAVSERTRQLDQELAGRQRVEQSLRESE